DEPFAVVLADDLCLNLEGDSVLAQMVKLYNQFRCSIVAIQEVPRDETSKYGVIAGEMIRGHLPRQQHGGEAQARGRAVEPGDHWPLYPYSGYIRPDPQHAAGQGWRD